MLFLELSARRCGVPSVRGSAMLFGGFCALTDSRFVLSPEPDKEDPIQPDAVSMKEQLLPVSIAASERVAPFQGWGCLGRGFMPCRLTRLS
jgi:hypothetical protein